MDIPWLCSRGHSVTATELSPIAVEGLFKENSIPHVINGTTVFASLVPRLFLGGREKRLSTRLSISMEAEAF